MPKLILKQNQLDYVGLFSKPAFPLYGNGGKLLEGIYSAFAAYQITLSDIRDESTFGRPSELALTVNFGFSSVFKLKLDRVEFVVYGFTSEDLQVFPQILRSSQDWLQSVIPDFSWESHLFRIMSHNALSDCTSEQYLHSLSSIDIPEIGISEGSGIIYHWSIPNENWRVQLGLDHSTIVPAGLFINYLLRPNAVRVNYEETTLKGYELFKRALAAIDLEVEDNA